MTIAEIAALIRTAIYGRDVRESIAKGIETINESTIQQINVISTDTNSKIVNITTNTDVKLATMNSTIENNNNGADGKINSMMGEISEFKTEVNGKVSTIATDVTDKVNALDIEVDLRTPEFGANLLKATEDFDPKYWDIATGSTMVSNIKGTLKGYSVSNAFVYVVQLFDKLVVNRQYTISAFVKSDTPNTKITVMPIDVSVGQTEGVMPEANKWYRYYMTFNATQAQVNDKRIGIVKTENDGSTLQVCGIQLAEGTNKGYTPSLKADSEQESWKTATLKNGWNTYGYDLQYYKDTMGRVHLRSNSLPVETVTAHEMFVTEPGYRPGHDTTLVFTGQATSGEEIIVRGSINIDGVLMCPHLGITSVNLTGANWRAEQ